MNEMIIYRFMNGIEDILVPLGICVVLPVLVVWLVMRHKKNETNRRTEIVLAALNNNSDIDVEEFLKKLNPPQKSVKSKLLQKLMWGSILTALGIFFGGYAVTLGIMGDYDSNLHAPFVVVGGILFMVGLAILIVYQVSTKVMANELEAENKSLEQ